MAHIRKAGGVILGKTNTPEFGAGANTTNRVYGATGNPFDPAKTCAGSSGGSAVALALGQVPLATGSGLRRQPAHAGRLLRRRRASGPRPAWCRASIARPQPQPVQRHGADGPHASPTRTCCCARRSATTSAIPSPPATVARIPAGLTGADLGKLRVAVSPDLGCAPVDRAIARTFRRARRRASGPPSARCRSGRPTSRRARDVRDAALRAVRRRAPRAPGEGARAARPQRHRQHRARPEAVARRREPRARRADQALQALPRLLPRGRRADLPGRLRLAVPARAAVRGGDQRREDADLHALARHHLRADHGAGLRRRPAVRRGSQGHAVRHPGDRPQRRGRARAGRSRTRWSRCWRAIRRRRGRYPLSPFLRGRGQG